MSVTNSNIKVLHTTARYFPDKEKLGGLQTHISELSRSMKSLGVDVSVAASIDSIASQNYSYNEVDIFRYPVYPEPPREPNHGNRPHGRFNEYQKWFFKQDVNIYHQHQWTPKCGYSHLILAKQRKIPTVMSIHVPLPICRKGTLMYEDNVQCNGKIETEKCMNCFGINNTFYKKQIAHLPESLALLFYKWHQKKTEFDFLQTLYLPRFIESTKVGLKLIEDNCDSIVVACDWLKALLIENDIAENKVILNRYGIAEFHQLNLYSTTDRYRHYNLQKPELRIGFFGRWTPIKGPDLLIKAFKNIPVEKNITLTLHGIVQDTQYEKQLIEMIKGDERVSIAHDISLPALSNYIAENFDIIAVPSQWLETGPLMVLHANAAGVPVVGSNLGGIREMIIDGFNGKLLPHDNLDSWVSFFNYLYEKKDVLLDYRLKIKPVRTITQQAEQLIETYNTILTRPPYA